MDGVVSPYDLSAQGSGAMAALMLCDRCVTFLPVRAEDISEEGVERAATHSARFEGLLKHWGWSLPLWREGVLAAAGVELTGEKTLYDEVMGVRERIGSEPALAALRAVGAAGTRPSTEDPDTEETFLDEASRDLVRGGGDPGVSVPVMAALERYAATRNLWLIQSPASSMVGKLERRMGRGLFSTTAPFPTSASGEAILDAREALHPQLVALRAGMDECVEMVRAGATEPDIIAFSREVIEPCAAAYEAAFADHADEFMFGEGGKRAAVMLRLTCVRLAPETALAAAVGAAAVLRGGATKRRAVQTDEATKAEGAIGTALGGVGALALSVKELKWDVGA